MQFHQSAARFKGFSGPIGSGKSQALCQEAIKLSYRNAGRLGLIGAPTYPMLRDSTQAAMIEILERSRLPYDLNKAENSVLMKDTRSRILFRAVDEFERLRGTNLAWFGLDELTYTPEEAWLRLEGRLRDPKAKHLCGFAVWTPKGFDWVYRRFVESKVEGYEVFLARPFENRHLLERVPDFYDRLRHSYDERFYQQEVLGSYLNVAGDRVYHAFERTANVADGKPDFSRPLLWALDFNVDPMSSLVAQTSGDEVTVLDEIVMRRATTRQACEEFGNRFPAHAPGLVIYGDASGHQMHTTGGNDYAVIRQFMNSRDYRVLRYSTPRVNPPVRDRVALVNSKLKNARGEAHLKVDPRCKELILDLEQVIYKTGSGVIDKERDSQRTHLSDALGYLLWQEFGPRAPAGPVGRPLLSF
ncbi:MAG: terminase large subunit domain-containing protein [Bryobacteraceae bacterium]